MWPILKPLINAIAFALPVALCTLSIIVSYRILRLPDLGMTGGYIVGAYSYSILLIQGYSIGVALSLALLAGAIAGATTGLLHFKFGLNSLLGGIATYYCYRALAARLALSLYEPGSTARSPVVNFDRQLGVGEFLNRIGPSWSVQSRLPIAHATFAALTVLCVASTLAWFANTRLGTVLRAFGDNREAAIEGGFPRVRLGVFALALAGGLASMAGASLMFINSTVNIDSGGTILLEAFAAYFVGDAMSSAIFRQPRYRASQLCVVALGGSVIYQLLKNVTQVLASRFVWVEATDYGFAFAVILVVLAYAVLRTDQRRSPRPVSIY